MHLHKWSKWTVRRVVINRPYREQVVRINSEDQVRSCSKCGLTQVKEL